MARPSGVQPACGLALSSEAAPARSASQGLSPNRLPRTSPRGRRPLRATRVAAAAPRCRLETRGAPTPTGNYPQEPCPSRAAQRRCGPRACRAACSCGSCADRAIRARWRPSSPGRCSPVRGKPADLQVLRPTNGDREQLARRSKEGSAVSPQATNLRLQVFLRDKPSGGLEPSTPPYHCSLSVPSSARGARRGSRESTLAQGSATSPERESE